MIIHRNDFCERVVRERPLRVYMSCNDDDKRDAILNHLKHHMVRTCKNCNIAMKSLDGALPFGNAMMTTWTCSICKQEDITVIQEDGTMLEVSSSKIP